MIFINTKNAFPLAYRSGALVIKVKQPLSVDQAEDINALAHAKLGENVRKIARQSRDHSLFLKVNEIRALTKRLRITTGIAKPFDYHLKELQNNILLEEKFINAPRLCGHFILKKWGIAHRAGLIFDNLHDQIGAACHLKNNPQDTNQVIENGLRLLNSLIHKNIFHMDPRLENMMLAPRDISHLSVIDFEHCYIAPPADRSLMAGLIAGMFYRSGVEAKISETDFDGLVSNALGDYVRSHSFWKAYSISKPEFMDRNTCRRAFLTGKLKK